MIRMHLCAMQRGAKNAIVRNKDQDFVAFVIHPDADYQTVITKAADTLNLNA